MTPGVTSLYIDTAKRFVPNNVVTVRIGDKPWYSSNLSLLRRKKERAHGKPKLSLPNYLGRYSH